MKLVFGQPPTKVKRTNPLIAAYGPGPEGKRCSDCVFLEGRRYARTYYKCLKRLVTSSAATDHGKSFPACGAFKEEELS